MSIDKIEFISEDELEDFEKEKADTTKEEESKPVEEIEDSSEEVEKEEETGSIEEAEASEEEEEEEEVKKTPKADNAEENLFKFNFNLLKERGALYLPDDYEFEDTEEGLLKAIDDSEVYRNQLVAQAIIDQLPSQEGKALLEYLYNGGTDINAFVQAFATTDYSKVDKEKLDDNAKKTILKDYYSQATKFSEDRINKLIERAEDNAELDDAVDEALSELVKLQTQSQAQLIESQKRAAAEQAKFEREYQLGLDQALATSKLPQKRKESLLTLFENTETDLGEIPLFQKIQEDIFLNPVHFVQYLDFLLDYDPKSGFKKGVSIDTKKARNMQEVLAEARKKTDSKSKIKGGTSGPERTRNEAPDKIQTIEVLFDK